MNEKGKKYIYEENNLYFFQLKNESEEMKEGNKKKEKRHKI